MSFGRFYIYPDDGVDVQSRGLALPSVTSAIAELYKAEVERWQIETALGGLDPAQVSQQAMAQGRIVHRIIAAKALGRRVVVQAKQRGYVNAWQAFCDENVRDFSYVEKTIYNLDDGYAGTLDATVELRDGRMALVDWKCSKRAYPEAALQLSAYYRGVTADGSVPTVNVARVVALHEDGSYEQSAVDVGLETYKAFLGLLEVHRWRYRHSDEVLTPVPAPVLGWGGSEARKTNKEGSTWN